ncbi:hypothetical protein DCAR_0100255 [Daucus carota subsp. sativus]|uniref:Uncharacterized protein n=1 Tax=Daucus carota subsp. sativus TaxID=79200 RepID=A0AAF0VZM7_DAUCS|nr:hypothetical protein DCAR_0100255 [Daucus carota subsp. sativus]
MQRCSSKAGIRDCPPHRPEEQWLCCFACLQRETQKTQGIRANLLLEEKLGKSIERAGSALALLPSARLRREKKRNSPVS